jgi:hypothetical protein
LERRASLVGTGPELVREALRNAGSSASRTLLLLAVTLAVAGASSRSVPSIAEEQAPRGVPPPAAISPTEARVPETRVPDGKAPQIAVAEVNPEPGAQQVALNTAVLVAFRPPIDEAALARAHLQVDGVEGRVSPGRRGLIFWPSKRLSPATTYSVVLHVDGDGSGGTSHRQQWQFRTGSQAIALGAYQVPTPAGKALLFRYPYLQSHSSRTVTVVWGTTQGGKAALQIRPAATDAWLTVPARALSFPAKVTGLPSDFIQQEAAVDGLDADTRYEYQILHDGSPIAAGIPLKTIPAEGNGTVRFVAFGDSGTKYSEPRAVRDAILSRNADGSARYPHDFVVGLGDIAYTSGTYVEFDENFFGQMSGKGDRGNGLQSLLASRPFVAVLGNHEYAVDERVIPRAFLDSFVNPTTEGTPAADAERYYSFDSGDVHFVVLDSMKFERPETPGQREMLAWLDRDLRATKRKWRIALFHHAIFAHGEHGTYGDIGQNRTMRQRLAPILQRHGVQLVLFGHDHIYERSKRLRVDARGRIERDGDCRIIESSRGIVYVVVGIGGADLHGRKVDPEPCGTPGFDRAVREYGDGYDFVAMRDGAPVLYDGTDRAPRQPATRHGFLHAVVTPSRLAVTAYNIKGEVLDSFELRE